MDRRKYLIAVGTGIIGSVSGCSSSSNNGSKSNQGKSGQNGPNVSKKKPDDDETVKSSNRDKYTQVEFPQSWTYSRDVQGLRLEYAKIASKQWEKKLGIKSKIRTGALSNIYSKWINTNFDIHWGGGWGGRPARLDPKTFLNAFASGKYSDINYCNYKNSKYNKIVKKSRSAINKDNRQQYVYQAQNILNEDVPVIFMFATNSLAAANTQNWKNYVSGVGSRPYSTVWNWKSMRHANGSDKAGVMADTRFPTTINPMGVEANIDMVATRFFYDRLARIDTEGQPKPWAATDWTAKNDTTYNVTLRDGMTFHDGKPVTSKDVKFTINYYKKWDVPYIKSFYSIINKTKLLGKNKIQFQLNEPDASFIATSLSQLAILPKHIWENVPEREGIDHPRNWTDFDKTGSGPVSVASYDSSGKIMYETYGKHFSNFNIDNFILNKYGGKSVALGDVENGGASYLEELQPNQYDRVKSKQSVKATKAPSHGWGAIYLNNSRPPLDDKAVRQAMYHALDKDLILKTVFNGYADSIETPIPPAMKYWHNPDLEEYDGGTQKARQILVDAGYKWDQNGNLLMKKR